MKAVKPGQIVKVKGQEYMFDRISATFYNTTVVQKKTGRGMLIRMMRAGLPVPGALTGDDLEVVDVQKAVDGVAIL